MNICQHLTSTAKLLPGHVAIVFADQSITYSTLAARSAAAAVFLQRQGVQRGDRVALRLPNVPAFAVWYYATLRIGAIAVSLNTRHAQAETEWLMRDCDARTLVGLPDESSWFDDSTINGNCQFVCTNSLGDVANGEPLESTEQTFPVVDMDPDDPALILYTSGTTGFSKGAVLSHLNVRSNVCAFNHLCDMRSSDRILLAVPLFHCFGQNALLNSALNVGATLVFQQKFDPHESRMLIKQHDVTQLYGVPMMFQLFLDNCSRQDLKSVRYCFSAAATLAVQVGQRWQQQFGLPIHQGYGLTETSPFASYNHRLRFVPGSIGTPINCVEMKIVNPQTGQTCSPGQLGEIAVRGPNVMLGYWNRPDDTAAAIRDGWFFSGDIGRCDDDGFYYIVDRVKDMISVGGQKVYPAEVERVLLDVPTVSQCAVVGLPDELFGERVVAFVVFEPSSSADSSQRLSPVDDHARRGLANYQTPREYLEIDELPRNPSGKILKTELRRIAAELSAESSAHQPPLSTSTANRNTVQPVNPEPDLQAAEKAVTTADIVQRSSPQVRPASLRQQLTTAYPSDRQSITEHFLQGLVQTLTACEKPPSVQTRFLDTGMDSLMLVEMSAQVQTELGPHPKVPATLVFDYPRICDLSQYLLEVINPDDTLQSLTAPPVKTTLRQDSPNNNQLAGEVENMSAEEVLQALMDEIES